MVSGKCDKESGSGSSSSLVGASKQQAASFRETYGRSGSEDDNASGVGYGPPDGSRDLDLGFPLFVALEAAVGVFSLGVLKASTC